MKLPPRRSFQLPDSRVHTPKHRGYKTEHIRLVARIDIGRKKLIGVATLTVAPLDSNLREIELDACSFELGQVTVDGKEAQFEYDNDVLLIRAGHELGRSAHEVAVQYSTTSTNRGIHFVGPDDYFPTKPVQVWTHSETQDARYWYPCNDRPNDRATTEMVITVPDEFQCVSNGRLLSQDKNGDGGRTYHWREDVPHSTYLNSLAVGKFEEIRDEADGVPLVYYFDKSNVKDALRFFGETPSMLRAYHQIIGVHYPYAQYAQVAVRDFVFGGMEHVAATTMTDMRFPDERSEADYSSTYSRPDRTPRDLVAHELVHQWYGDLVTTVDWPHAWLNEGFATYFSSLYTEKSSGADEFRRELAYRTAAYLEEDEKRYRRSVVERSYVYPDDLFDAVLYEKASLMLHQLRFILGDALFFSGMTVYLKRFTGKNIDTDDLRKVLEEVSGRDLSSKFEQFFYRPGHPEFEVEYSWNEASSSAELSVRQVQNTDDGTPIFRLPCDLVFYTSRGREKRRVELGQREERFSFQLESSPTIVEFDPEEWLLKTVEFRKTHRMLANQLESSVDATSRVRAAQALSVFKTDGTVEMLKRAIQREQFWAVRVEAARSLGKIGSSSALASLLSAVDLSHRKVRRAVIEGLGNFKGEDAVRAIRKALLEDISPNVQAEAALSLAKTESKDALRDLRQAMQIPSPNSTLTEACLEAMGGIRDELAKKVIDEYLRYGVPTRARIGALKGLKARGFVSEDEVATLRAILASDREFAVRLQVVSLVSDLADSRFLGALSAAAKEDVDKRVRRRALEVINELTGAADMMGRISRLRTELQEMREENDRLRAQLASRD